MCNKCSICKSDITLEDIKNGRRTVETEAPNGGTFMSHKDCVDRVVVNVSVLAGSKPCN